MEACNITVYEVARRSKTFPSYIYGLLAAGLLRGTKVDGRWQINLRDFETWQRNHKFYATRRRDQQAVSA